MVGNDDQVKMIAHQAVCENLQTVLVGIVLQEFQIAPTVFTSEEHVLPPITALRDMMRDSGNYRSGYPWHAELYSIKAGLSSINTVSVPIFPEIET